VIISLQHWLNSSQRRTGENSLFMLAMQGLTLLKNVEHFAKKMDCDSLPIHHIDLISHHLTSFCSVLSKMSQRNGVSIIRGITRRNWWSDWLTCLSTGWRDWNGCLRTMVITIHKLPVGPFTFLQCLSGTELLNLSAKPICNS
jgi:hypothetical protein